MLLEIPITGGTPALYVGGSEAGSDRACEAESLPPGAFQEQSACNHFGEWRLRWRASRWQWLSLLWAASTPCLDAYRIAASAAVQRGQLQC